jgi:peroxiredoxin family protein
MMKNNNVASLLELRQLAVDLGVNMYGCQMSMDVMEISSEDMIDEVTDYVGAGFFIEQAHQADFTMFI